MAAPILREVAPSSRWCQRWSARRPTWQFADPGDRFDARRYEVHPVDDPAAKAYVIANHYTGSYPAAVRRLGLYRAGALVGVAIFSVPARRQVLTAALPDCDPYRESLELGRFILNDAEPGNAESWFLARCFGDFLIPAGVRGVVSFADPVSRAAANGTLVVPGHVGWIYQASNAVYTGRGTPRTLTILRDGSTLNDRTAQKIRRQECGHNAAERRLIALGAHPCRAGQQPAVWLAEALADVGASRVRHRGCHRYVFPLGRNARARARVTVGLAAAPYPKHADTLAGAA